MEKSFTIVFCLPENTFSNQFITSWSETLLALTRSGHKVLLTNENGENMLQSRNLCLGGKTWNGKTQSPFQGQIEYDYMVWINGNVAFTPQHIARMIEHMESDTEKHIISGCYLRDDNQTFDIIEQGNWDFNKFINQGGEFHRVTRDELFIKRNSLFKADYIGFGFVCLRKGVMESLEYPWFKPLFYDFTVQMQDPSGQEHERQIRGFENEEAGISRSFIEKGYDIWVDPILTVGKNTSQILHFPHSSLIKQLNDNGTYEQEVERVQKRLDVSTTTTQKSHDTIEETNEVE